MCTAQNKIPASVLAGDCQVLWWSRGGNSLASQGRLPGGGIEGGRRLSTVAHRQQVGLLGREGMAEWLAGPEWGGNQKGTQCACLDHGKWEGEPGHSQGWKGLEHNSIILQQSK